MKRRTLNSTYQIGGVYFRSVSRSCSKYSFMDNQKLVYQIKFRGESPPPSFSYQTLCINKKVKPC